MSGGYHREIPTLTKRAPTMPMNMPSPLASPRLPSGSPNNKLPVPNSSPHSNASSNDSFVEQAFVDFSEHAFRCDRCYDPVRTHMDGGRLCRVGRRLATNVKLTLRDESRAFRRHRRTQSDEAYIRIPKGCEPVQQLLRAMEKGLEVKVPTTDAPMSPTLAIASPFLPSPPASPHMKVVSPSKYRHDLGESFDPVYYVPARMPTTHTSDEERNPRRSRRHSHNEHDVARPRRSNSVGARVSSAFYGIEERQRRPYGLSSPHSSNDKISTDSGYDSTHAPPSPDLRRGSQYAEDMRRRHGLKPALKKVSSFERDTGIRVPSSPNRLKGVGFNLGGKYKVPGYD